MGADDSVLMHAAHGGAPVKGTFVSVFMLGGALAAGCAAAYFADGYIEKSVRERRAAIDAQYQPVSVVVASENLRAGALLSNQTVAIREMPRAFLHSDAVLAERWSDITGRVLARAVRSGEPVLRSHVAQDLGAGFSGQLGAGMRALTFPVDEESSISGMLSPGDRIDIFFTTTAGNETVTVPLLVDVPILATGVRTVANTAFVSDRQQPGPFRTVTVSVTPQDAARITLAQDSGKITIALRQPEDQDRVQVARITKSALLNSSRNARPAMPRAKVEIIIGNM
jgi:pilus assembly protein CpaB